jgi:hypothetical protein
MFLLIDDLRNINVDFIARNAEAGRESLSRLNGLLTHVVFDHDLGEEESGYDVLVWGLSRGLIPQHVQLITDNPVGRDNMIAALVHDGYTSKNRLEYFKENKGTNNA